MLDDRAERERREILQEVENDDDAEQQADEERPMGRESAAEAGGFFLAANEPASASTGMT